MRRFSFLDVAYLSLWLWIAIWTTVAGYHIFALVCIAMLIFFACIIYRQRIKRNGE